MAIVRHDLGLTGIELPSFGIRASKPFDVFGKESQTARARLVRTAIDRDIDFFATSPGYGEGERILAAGLIGYRHRATVMSTIRNPELAAAYREIDISLHLFDRHIDILLADRAAASDELLTSFARMRAMGDVTAFGIACQTVDDLREVSTRIVVDGIDLVSIPATILLSNAANQAIMSIVRRRCALIAYVPDGLESIGGESLDNMKVNPKRHGLKSVGDVLAKLALSDQRIASVAIPARRIRDLDRFETIASAPAFTSSEMEALRTA